MSSLIFFRTIGFVDKFCRFIPVLNTLSGLTRLFIKCVVQPLVERFSPGSSFDRNLFIKKINKDSIFKTVLLTVPLLGVVTAIILKCKKGVAHPPRTETSKFISAVLKVPIDKNRQHPIPQKIHRFWSGGAMSEGSMEILQKSAEKIRGTGWSSILWFSAKLERKMEETGLLTPLAKLKREEQRNLLRKVGYEIRSIEELTDELLTDLDLDKLAEKAIKHAVQSDKFRWDGIKYFSDMARLFYLYKIGGHHFDVDMGLGDMDLGRGFYHNDPDGKIPLFGAAAVECTNSIVESFKTLSHSKELSNEREPVQTAAKNIIEQAKDMASMLNGMIASRKKNPHFKIAIEQLLSDSLISDSELPSGMTVNKTLLVGNKTPAFEDYQIIKALSVPAYLLDVEQLTSESSNR